MLLYLLQMADHLAFLNKETFRLS